MFSSVSGALKDKQRAEARRTRSFLKINNRRTFSIYVKFSVNTYTATVAFH
jgi:hypothetical protein